MTMDYVRRNAGGITTNNATVAINFQRSTIISDEVSQWVKEGRVFQAGEGALNTPATEAPTSLATTTPAFYVRVPAGKVIVPLMVIWVPVATTAVAHLLIRTGASDPGTANMTSVSPVNVNTRFAANSSGVTAYNVNAGATTAPTTPADLYREYHQADRDAITGAPTPPLIYNPRMGLGQEAAIGNNVTVQSFLVYAITGTTGTNTAFIIATWAEFTYDEYYS